MPSSCPYTHNPPSLPYYYNVPSPTFHVTVLLPPTFIYSKVGVVPPLSPILALNILCYNYVWFILIQGGLYYEVQIPGTHRCEIRGRFNLIWQCKQTCMYILLVFVRLGSKYLYLR